MPIPYLDKLQETAQQIAVIGRPKPADGVNRVSSQDHDAQPLDSPLGSMTEISYRPTPTSSMHVLREPPG